jgi:cytochrome c5
MKFTHKLVALVIVIAGLLVSPFPNAHAAGEDGKTVWQGVYTSAQATRGLAAYRDECSRCHGEDLSGYRSVLTGDRFMQQWREDNLRSLFNRVKTMPPNAPASLQDAAYIDIIAYLLQMNSFPAGSRQLEEKSLDRIRVEGKEGPEPVPDFSLVEVVGCLSRDAAGKWMVSQASEPVRTRNPFDSPAAELDAAGRQPSGRRTFRILDASNLPAGLHNLDKVKAKGFLIRNVDNDRLNITSVEHLAGACTQ